MYTFDQSLKKLQKLFDTGVVGVSLVPDPVILLGWLNTLPCHLSKDRMTVAMSNNFFNSTFGQLCRDEEVIKV